MLQKMLVVIVWVGIGLAAAVGVAAEKLPPAADWLPADALAVLELSRPDAVLDLLLDEQMVKAIKANAVYQKATASPGYQQMLGGVKYMEGQLGTDWATAVRTLAGGGITVAVTPNGAVLIVDSKDAKMLTKLHDLVLALAKMGAAGKPDLVKSTEYAGVTCYSVGDQEAHAIVGTRLVIANKPKLLQATLDRRDAKGGRSLSSLPAYQSARKAYGSGSAGLLLANLGTLKNLPQVQAALNQNRQPMGALLFASLFDAVRDANWLALELRVGKNAITLDAKTDAKAGGSELTAFTWPKTGEGALPNLAVPRRIAAMSFYRDLHGFYTAKDKLFPERTSGLIFFENMMGIFFSGRNLTDEVLAEAKPEIRFVVAEQAYDPAVGTPSVQVPAFAAIFRVKHPKEFTEIAEEAWQKAVGLVTITSGQKGQSGMIIDRDRYKDVRFSMAYFSTSRIEDKQHLPVQYNFRPTLAMFGENMILSSTDGLAKDLIDALGKETARVVADSHSVVELDVAQLASVLGANRMNMIRQNMVEKGNSQQQAEGEIDALLAILKHFRSVHLDLGTVKGKPRARLEVEAKLQ